MDDFYLSKKSGRIKKINHTNMKKIILFSLFLINFLMISPNSAQACSCMMPAPPVESMDQSAAVFSGKVVALEKADMSINVNFEVAQVWKGGIDKEVILTTALDSAACGYAFEEGKDYLVYAYEHEGALETGLCSRTALLADAQEDVEALGAGQEPSASLSEYNPTTFNPIVIVIGAGIVLILGGFILFRNR